MSDTRPTPQPSYLEIQKQTSTHMCVWSDAHTYTQAVFMDPGMVPTHLPDPIRAIRLIGRRG